MKKIKRQYGTWYYRKRRPNIINRLKHTVYELYSYRKRFLNAFSTYEEMQEEIEIREFIEELKARQKK